MASISTIVTRGFGTFGSVNELPTLGYGIGVATEADLVSLTFTDLSKQNLIFNGSLPDPLRSKLLVFYRNNGTDRSGNDNNASAVGSPTTTTGIGGAPNAAYLGDGTNSNYWHLPTNFLTDGDFTIAIWYNSLGNPQSNSNAIFGFSKGNIDVNGTIHLEVNGTALRFTWVGSPFGKIDINGTGIVDKNQFNLLIGTCFLDPDTFIRTYKFYLNGVYAGENDQFHSTNPDYSGTQLDLGASFADGGALQYAAIWGRALTDGGVSLNQTATISSDIGRLATQLDASLLVDYSVAPLTFVPGGIVNLTFEIDPP